MSSKKVQSLIRQRFFCFVIFLAHEILQNPIVLGRKMKKISRGHSPGPPSFFRHHTNTPTCYATDARRPNPLCSGKGKFKKSHQACCSLQHYPGVVSKKKKNCSAHRWSMMKSKKGPKDVCQTCHHVSGCACFACSCSTCQKCTDNAEHCLVYF